MFELGTLVEREELGSNILRRAAYGLAKKLGETSLIVPVHCNR
jgi:hypothetical protein